MSKHILDHKAHRPAPAHVLRRFWASRHSAVARLAGGFAALHQRPAARWPAQRVRAYVTIARRGA